MKTDNGYSGNLGFENKLWKMADKMCGYMNASEYKHVVLRLLFLKNIFDAFQAKYDQLEKVKEAEYTDPDDRDKYAAANIFWVLKEARWDILQSNAKQPTIGKLIDHMHRELSNEEIDKITGTYHAWRGEKNSGKYNDVPRFCKRVTADEIKDHSYVLTPGRYVGTAEVEKTIKKNLEAL